jgi:hypothetical protein
MQRNLDTLFPTSTASLWPAAKRAALMQFRMATYMKVGAGGGGGRACVRARVHV